MNRSFLWVVALVFPTGIVMPTSFAAQAPYGGVAWSLPGPVEAENYDTRSPDVPNGTVGFSPSLKLHECPQATIGIEA